MNGNPDLLEILAAAAEISRKANRHGHPLKGSGFYALKFAELHTSATVALSCLRNSLGRSEHLHAQCAELEAKVKLFFTPESNSSDRSELQKQIRFLWKTEIETATQRTLHAPSDELFPLEIVRGTRGYIERIAEQACGSYDQQWYDAAAVMARRLLETLIIETYEAHSADVSIKKPDGTFFYLSGLIGVLLNETRFNVGRNTKSALPKLKDLGDQSAHSRRYLAKKKDLDDVKRELRVTLEELVHLSKLKK